MDTLEEYSARISSASSRQQFDQETTFTAEDILALATGDFSDDSDSDGDLDFISNHDDQVHDLEQIPSPQKPPKQIEQVINVNHNDQPPPKEELKLEQNVETSMNQNTTQEKRNNTKQRQNQTKQQHEVVEREKSGERKTMDEKQTSQPKPKQNRSNYVTIAERQARWEESQRLRREREFSEKQTSAKPFQTSYAGPAGKNSVKKATTEQSHETPQISGDEAYKLFLEEQKRREERRKEKEGFDWNVVEKGGKIKPALDLRQKERQQLDKKKQQEKKPEPIVAQTVDSSKEVDKNTKKKGKNSKTKDSEEKRKRAEEEKMKMEEEEREKRELEERKKREEEERIRREEEQRAREKEEEERKRKELEEQRKKAERLKAEQERKKKLQKKKEAEKKRKEEERLKEEAKKQIKQERQIHAKQDNQPPKPVQPLPPKIKIPKQVKGKNGKRGKGQKKQSNTKVIFAVGVTLAAAIGLGFAFTR
ncbi:hypothetical protein BLNAU_15791 [Blattamonas nauphoetae]|uniref:Uncharacterized protein n=1 Tax=Blattamonas nauphoetae TaxID=2049346 RepID=A0ABQ9XD94_9EUKA|nr:hypothetical protein BLNAU_15791 [Blattamonas nauphoetae]